MPTYAMNEKYIDMRYCIIMMMLICINHYIFFFRIPNIFTEGKMGLYFYNNHIKIIFKKNCILTKEKRALKIYIFKFWKKTTNAKENVFSTNISNVEHKKYLV